MPGTDTRLDDVAALGHRLRDCLAPLRSASQLLAVDPSGPTIGLVRDAIGRQADHMAELIDDLFKALGRTTGADGGATATSVGPARSQPAAGSWVLVVGGCVDAEVVARQVAACGVAVRLADDFVIAARLAAADRPAFVLVDADANPESWPEAVRAIRVMPWWPAAAVVTRRPDEVRGEMTRAGVEHLLVKPVGGDALAVVLAYARGAGNHTRPPNETVPEFILPI